MTTFACLSPTPFAAHGHVIGQHVHNNKEIAFTYTEVLVYSSFTGPREVLILLVKCMDKSYGKV